MPNKNYLAKPSALQHFQRQHQLHSSSCTSLPNTPPQNMAMNPFHNLPTQIGAFNQNNLGGVTVSLFPVTTKEIGASSQPQQMTPIQNDFAIQDPKIILSQQSALSAGSQSTRRLLPQVPSPNSSQQQLSELINQTLSTNPTMPEFRRTSSSRMLPTPPPPISPNAFSQSPSPPFNSTGEISRRTSSTGRRLPPEPTTIINTSLPPPAPTHLQRSASARTTTNPLNITNKWVFLGRCYFKNTGEII